MPAWALLSVGAAGGAGFMYFVSDTVKTGARLAFIAGAAYIIYIKVNSK